MGRPHLGSPYSYQTRYGMSSIPHSKVHDPSHKKRRIEGRPAYLMALMGWIQASLSSNGTPTFLHRP